MRFRPALTLVFTAPTLLGGCAWIPGLDDPGFTVAPRMELMEIRGKTRMQSISGGLKIDNPTIDLDDFGAADRDEAYGGTLAIGDGFSGLEISYLQLDARSSRRGTLTSDWGALRQGDQVTPEYRFDEYRIRYVARVFGYEIMEDKADIVLGVGAMLAHRDMRFAANEVSGARSQKVKSSDDGLPYLGGRLRADYLQFGAQVDYMINPDVDFGGDYEGVNQDFEARLFYTLEDQDLTLFAAYRRQELGASGNEGVFRFDSDLTLASFVLGFSFRF